MDKSGIIISARCGVDYFDFYLLHSLEEGYNLEVYEKLKCFEWAVEKKAQGKIRHFGFSFHGGPECLEKTLDAHPEVDFVQIQMNYADWENPVVCSGKLQSILHERNIPIVVMEPVKGGILAQLTPELEAIYKAVHPDKSIASWALRFAASQPGVMTVLSGMSTPEQMADNIRTITHFEPIAPHEQAAIDQVKKIMLEAQLIRCTSCRYCTDGCPMNISIPDIFRAVNTIRIYHDDARPKFFYRNLTDTVSGKASSCIGCEQCQRVCPQHLPIVELLKEAAGLLEE